MTEDEAADLGRKGGHDAGTWVIDGNTTREEASRILRGIHGGDPEVMDLMPAPLSGEWAGESLAEIFGVPNPDPAILDAYELGYDEAFWAVVEDAARAVIE